MEKTIGSKREVYYGEALKTKGGLTKGDLIPNKRGKIVSKLQHARGKILYSNIAAYTIPKRGGSQRPAGMPAPILKIPRLISDRGPNSAHVNVRMPFFKDGGFDDKRKRDFPPITYIHKVQKPWKLP